MAVSKENGGNWKMKRSLSPIMAAAFALVTVVSAVTPASACWWGHRHHWHDGW
jgi:hypothetical protein